ncbi:MAG: FlgD immunoglobulin-like domain containing protein [Puniceicoccales bacterium]
MEISHSIPQQEGEFIVVSDAVSPEVSFCLDPSNQEQLELVVRVEPFDDAWPAPTVELGLYAGRVVHMSSSEDATYELKDGIPQFSFTVPTVDLGGELEDLRMAFSVSWMNAAGEVAQKEGYWFIDGVPPFAGVGTDPDRWSSFSLSEYAEWVANLSAQIKVSWTQPMDGKATVVINDSEGKRVRNLVSGKSFPAGKQSVVWDGLNEAGNLVAPGDYRWEVVSHPGITPEFKMSYYSPGNPGWRDGPTSLWLGDHSAPEAAATNGRLIALGCPIAESGNNIVIVDREGNKLNDANTTSHMGHGRIFLAMDDERVYALCEGAPSYSRLRKDEDGNEYLYASLNLIAWNLGDGREHRYRKGRETYQVVREYQLDPNIGKRHDVIHNLRGMVSLDGILYASLYEDDRIIGLNPETGEEVRSIALAKPGALATDGKRLIAYSDQELVRFEDPGNDSQFEALFTPALSEARAEQGSHPVGSALALSPEGVLFVADNGVDQNIKIYNLDGTELGHIGRLGGGVEAGEWVPDSVRLPTGLALDDFGQLWVAENHFRPKRISVWDANGRELKKELFGPSHYGASGAGFDTADLTRWLGGGASWKIDIDSGEVDIQSALFDGNQPGVPTSQFYPFSAWFIHQDDRTFVISKDAVMRLYEVMPDQSLKLWAMFGTLHGFEAEQPRWWVPEGFTEHPRLKEILVEFDEPVGPYDNFRNGPGASKEGRELAVMWIDRDGDGKAQVEEYQVAGDSEHRMLGSIWGYHYEDTLDWKVAVQLAEGQLGIGNLNFEGWLPSGAPNWNFESALLEAVPIPEIEMLRGSQSFLVDSRGRVLLNSHPMYGVGPDNEIEWSYPNDWNGVHGSHKAPLPETGVLQGALSYLGMAPLDDQGDVTVINGNHGRFFVMTTDGIYLDEMFQDVRLSRDASPYRIGGETFGGYFGRDKESGRYILQSGHSDYRIFEIHGLEEIERQGGQFSVSPEQIEAAQKILEKRTAESSIPRSATVPRGDGAAPAVVAEWGDASNRFPYAKVEAMRSGGDLILRYSVKDPSPWVNNGKDRNLIFKTGDVAVFEFSTDPDASRSRTTPAVGDRRLMVSPFEDGVIAILFDYRVEGTDDPVSFSSPWRSAFVDEVRVLEDAVVEVNRQSQGYELNLRIPLESLGLPEEGTDASLLGDFGIIYGDDGGNINVLRSYWSNDATGLVNDIPGETMINPSLWGEINWE